MAANRVPARAGRHAHRRGAARSGAGPCQRRDVDEPSCSSTRRRARRSSSRSSAGARTGRRGAVRPLLRFHDRLPGVRARASARFVEQANAFATAAWCPTAPSFWCAAPARAQACPRDAPHGRRPTGAGGRGLPRPGERGLPEMAEAEPAVSAWWCPTCASPSRPPRCSKSCRPVPLDGRREVCDEASSRRSTRPAPPRRRRAAPRAGAASEG